MGQIPPWADLPQELLSAIATFLSSNPIDIFRFRTVCKSWHSSVSLPTFLLSPLLHLMLPCPPPSFTHFQSSRPELCTSSVLSLTSVYALKSPEGSSSWVLFVDQLNPGRVTIRYPLSRESSSLPLDFPRKLNLLDFRVSEIGRYYNLSHGLDSPSGMLVKPTTWSQGFLKVVFPSNESGVLALSKEGKLGLIKLGSEKNVMGVEWEIIHNGIGFRFDDLVEYKGRFLGIDRRGRIYEMGQSFSGMNIIVPPIKGGGGRRKRLIESSGVLYLVVRCDVYGKAENMGNIKVYKLNEDARRWIEVPSIGDQIFFFGISFSFAAAAREFEGFCGKNCIIYEEYSFRKYDGGYGDSWLFNGSRNSCLKVGVYHLEDGAHLRAIESYPCHASILWPPPTWIWLNNKSKLLGTLEVAIDKVLLGIHKKNLKDKYEELSSVVKLVVCGDGFNQDIPNILEEIDILKEFMTEIDVVIKIEATSIKKKITTELSDQVRTSNFGMHGCVNCLQKANADSNNDEAWLSREINRRLYTYFHLSETLKGVIDVLEKYTYLKDLLSTDGKTLLARSV